MTNATLIFLHVPRTAGTTLQNIMMVRQYRQDEAHIEELFLPAQIERFAALPEDYRARLKLLKGHMAFGVHRHLPRPARYFTMIRDPIDRVVSFYYYIRRRTADPLHQEIVEKGLDLAAFVESGIARDHTDNSFVRLISGEPFVEMGSVDRTLLDQAKTNIRDHFVLTGSVEHFDETILMLKKAMGWVGSVYYWRRNVTAQRPAIESLDPRTRRVLEEHTQFDRALVDHCRSLFEAQRSAMPGSFQRELHRFKRRNAAMQRVYPMLQPVRQRLRSLRPR
jgi:hypothetical protein